MARLLKSAGADQPTRTQSRFSAVVPIILGGCFTAVFYAALPYLPVYRELATRYFCSHPLAYATAGLFFVAVAALLNKLWAAVPERQAVAAISLDAGQLAALQDDASRVRELREYLLSLPPSLRRTGMGQRIAEAAEFVRGRRNSAGLQEHLKYLAELTSERLHQSYAMVRTVTWAIPILGFLGTVIGITMAIANVTPEQLESSLGSVTSGLAVAFDTTALALALSIVLVFLTFIVERVEQRVSGAIEQFGIANLLPAFPSTDAHTVGGLAEAQQAASAQLIDATEVLVRQQMESWNEHVQAMRQRWAESLESQRTALESSLTEGLAATLSDHRTQLEEARLSLAARFEDAVSSMGEHFARLEQQHSSQVASSQSQFEEFWGQLQREAESLQQWQAESRRDLIAALTDVGQEWSGSLRSVSEASIEHAQQLQQQTELLSRVVEEETQLTRLQEVLTDNLTAVRTAATFEETLHSLNAAVHLLTMRVRPNAA